MLHFTVFVRAIPLEEPQFLNGSFMQLSPQILDIAFQGLTAVPTNPVISASHTRGLGEGLWFILFVFVL